MRSPAPTEHAPVRRPARRMDLGLLIFLTPIIWGVTFPATKEALGSLPLLPFMAWSRLLGFLAIAASIPFVARGEITWVSIKRIAGPGMLLGGLVFLGYTLQTAGLERTTATNTGFITGLYVVLTPLLGLILWRARVPRAAWGAAGASLVGLGLLSVVTFSDLRPRAGDLLVLAGAVAWSGHIAALGRLAARYPGRLLSLAQMGVAAVLHIVAAFAVDQGMHPGAALDVSGLLAITGVLGSGVGFTIQVVCQQEVSAARAAVILAGEAIVAAASAAVWLGERLRPHQWVGALLIVAAMIVSELGARRGPAERIEPGVG